MVQRPLPGSQCGHQDPAGLCSSSMPTSLQHKEQSPQVRPGTNGTTSSSPSDMRFVASATEIGLSKTTPQAPGAAEMVIRPLRRNYGAARSRAASVGHRRPAHTTEKAGHCPAFPSQSSCLYWISSGSADPQGPICRAYPSCGKPRYIRWRCRRVTGCCWCSGGYPSCHRR
jgi:hypothetical protein